MVFVIVDGLDGSGKGVIVSALRDWASKQNLKVIDLREYWEDFDFFPRTDYFDVIISAEPTFAGTGKKIREKLIQKGSESSALEIAKAYSDDRKELYEKIILPARAKNKFIFQERGVITSLVYQTLQGLSLEEVSNLEGNAFCLQNPPDLIIIPVVDPELVMSRLKTRTKNDNAIFEELEFQKRVKEIYESGWLRDFFEKKGSKVFYIDASISPKETVKQALEIFENFISV